MSRLKSLTAPQRTQVEGLQVDMIPEPPVRGQDLHLSPPTLAAPMADDSNLWASLSVGRTLAPHVISLANHAGVGNPTYGTIDFQVQQTLSQTLRDLNWEVRVALRGDEIIALG